MYAREICTSLEKPLGDIVLNYGALLLTSVQLVFAVYTLENKLGKRAGVEITRSGPISTNTSVREERARGV